MYIAGLQKTSLIDYPGKITAIIFVFGCNFSCCYCHNPELVKPKLKPEEISEEIFFKFLEKRKNVLDAVTVTGGEPTLYKDLPEFLAKIKTQGFLVKLDTNGTNPKMLKELIDKKLVDYIAMDIKAPLKKYKKITGKQVDVEKIKKSIDLIMNYELRTKNYELDYEFRTTVLPALHTKEDIIENAKLIKGAKKYFLQNFVARDKLLNSKLKKERGFKSKELEEIRKECSKFVKECGVR